MLVDKAMRGIGEYAKELTNSQRFGTPAPSVTPAIDLFLYSYALTNAEYLTEDEIKTIDTRISDIKL